MVLKCCAITGPYLTTNVRALRKLVAGVQITQSGHIEKVGQSLFGLKAGMNTNQSVSESEEECKSGKLLNEATRAFVNGL